MVAVVEGIEGNRIMKFLDGLGFGWLISGVAFWAFVLAIQPLKAPNPKYLALIFVVLETIITIAGIGISVYVMWKWNK